MPDATPPTFAALSIDDRAAWNAIAADDAKRAWLDGLRRKLAKIPDAPTMPSAADYLAAKRSNDRGRLDKHWAGDVASGTRNTLDALALVRLVDGIAAAGDGRDDRLLNWLFAYATEASWTVSAHISDKDLPLTGEPQTDLAGCEAAAMFAELREGLLPWLKRQSPSLAETIVREIDRRVIGPLSTGDLPWWGKSDATALMNWSGVCGGSVLAACLSLESQGLPRPACRDRMIDVVRRYFALAFSPDGECDEGIGYWSYGVEYACVGLSRMTPDAIASAMDLERVKLIASYPERCHLVGDTFFAGNDSPTTASAPLGAVPWLAEWTGDAFLRWWCGRSTTVGARLGSTAQRFIQRVRTDPTTSPAEPTHAPNRLLRDQQVGLFQRPSPRGLFSFTITGGNNAENHNHNDLGTFQAFVDDRAFVPDLGSPHYTADFFGPERYTKYLVAASGGHCCPAINGVEQRVGKEAQGAILGWSAETGEISLDLTSAYPPEAKLRRWTRSAHVPNDGATAIVDDAFTLDADGTIVHRIWFAEAVNNDDGPAFACGPIRIVLDPPPASAAIIDFLAGDPRLNLTAYPPAHRLYRLDATYAAKAGDVLRLTTRITVA